MEKSSPCRICSEHTHTSSTCPSLRDMRGGGGGSGGGGGDDDQEEKCMKKDVCSLSNSSFHAVKYTFLSPYSFMHFSKKIWHWSHGFEYKKRSV